MKPTHKVHRRLVCGGLLIGLLSLVVVLFSHDVVPSTAVRSGGGAARATAPTQARVTAGYGQVPLSFEANHGQAQEPVKFLARGTNATLYLLPDEAALEVQQAENKTALVKMKLVGANKQPQLQGQEELPGKSNYFSGNKPNGWKTNIPTYQRVKYSQVYEGIDLVYYGNQQQLEYDFIVQPSADPGAIKLRLEGAEQISLNAQGELVLTTAAGEVKQRKPVIYQEVNGSRQEIEGNYVLTEACEVQFAVGPYDHHQPLVIDPVISYTTFFGTLPATAIAVDKEGNAVVAGRIAATPGAYQSGSEQSVAKLNASGTAVLFSATFNAGDGGQINDLALDAQGNVYLTGRTSTSQFPTTPGAFQTDFGLKGANFHNAFVMKFNAQGNALLYSTFLKGDQLTGNTLKLNQGWAIAVDRDGSAYVTGDTNALDFPVTTGAFQTQNLSQNRTGFVAKLNAIGTGLIYATFLGSGSNGDHGTSIALDTAGNAYMTGITSNGWMGQTRPRSLAFPVTSGAFQTTDDVGNAGIYVTKLNTTGSALVYSTLLGRWYTSESFPPQIAVDSANCAYIAGTTISAAFPTTPGAFKTQGGGASTIRSGDINVDGFVAKLNAAGSGLLYSTYIGGNDTDRCLGIAVDADQNVHLTGMTNSADFPQIGLPPQSIGLGDNTGAFVVKMNPNGTALSQAIFLRQGNGQAIDTDQAQNVFIAGSAFPSFMTTAGAFQAVSTTSFAGGFVAKLSTPRSATTVDAASYTGETLAAESIASVFGLGLALTTRNAATTPLPTTLAGTTVQVKDSVGTQRESPLFFASPTQVNFQIPSGTANGPATITITNSEGAVSVSQVQIVNVKPAIFSADATGRGWAGAQIQRSGSTIYEPVVTFDPIRGQIVAVPIDLGTVNEQVYLVLYCTGIRLRSSLNAVTAKIGGIDTQVTYAGTQNGFVGLDQANVLLPRSLIGRGDINIELNVDGKSANVVKVKMK